MSKTKVWKTAFGAAKAAEQRPGGGYAWRIVQTGKESFELSPRIKLRFLLPDNSKRTFWADDDEHAYRICLYVLDRGWRLVYQRVFTEDVQQPKSSIRQRQRERRTA